jgi:hypothetical protein
MRTASCLALLLLPACFDFSCEFEEPEPRPAPPPPPRRVSPEIGIAVPDWPPLGKDATVLVTASHASGLTSLSYAFEKGGTRSLVGTSATVELRGSDLGEGWGRAEIRVRSIDGGESTGFIDGLLVDLTPPQIDAAGPMLLRHDSVFRVQASDAWILGGGLIEIGSLREDTTFPRGFPETFGALWDTAEFSIAVADLEPGVHTARVTVRDAAGNRMIQEYELELDGTAPEVSILSPTEGSTISDRLDVIVSAVDAEGDTWIDLTLAGTPVSGLAGPEARTELDVTDFPAG